MKLIQTLLILLVFAGFTSAYGQLRTNNKTSVVIQKGSALSLIANSRYGSRAYAGFLAAYNHVDPNRLQIGSVLETPDFDAALKSADLNEDAAKFVLKTYENFRSIEVEILKNRFQNSGKAVLAPLAPSILKRLSKLSTEVFKTGPEFFNPEDFSKSQSGRIQSLLENLTDSLQKVSTVSDDTYGSDHERVHLRLNAILEALLPTDRAATG